MPKQCEACGTIVLEVEPPPPPHGTVPEPDTCPNCGKTGTLKDVEDPDDEEDAE